ncbi:MAG: hypothetical protein JJU03_11760 [Idiomarina sp.]|nr:hypothetical protein [Idiomarina sp.]
MKLITKSLMGMLLLALHAGVATAHAEQGEDRQAAERALSQRMLACRSIESAVERLDCFDRVARSLDTAGSDERAGSERARGDAARTSAQARAAANREQADARQEEALQRAAEAREAGAARAEQGRSDNFGREHRRDPDADDDLRYVEITEAWQNPRGLWRFRMDDGSEWHQTQNERFQYDENANYFIERGILSSFRLGWEGSNRNIRIRRVD